MQSKLFIRCVCLLILTLSCSGCIPDRAYQQIGKSSLQYVDLQKEDTPKFGDNVAAIELNGSGDLQSCCGAAQLDLSEKMIRVARNSVKDKSKVVVITFIHGNQNNARLDSDNFPHFLQLLACLSSGSEEYNRHIAALQDGSLKRRIDRFKGSDLFECKQPRPAADVRYVGVYIGWRGSLNTLRLDFQQRAARRVADGSDILAILRRIRDAAKPVNTKPSRLLVLGHSFGGLILERAIYHLDEEQPTGAGSVKPFADVVITVNEATGGFLAKRLIEKTNGYSVAGLTPGSTSVPARPLLITMHSKTDPLTGPFATWGRRIAGPPPVPTAVSPENDKQFIEGDYVQSGDKPSIRTVRRSNPSNLLYFDNGCYIGDVEIEAVKHNRGYITGDHPGCDDVAKALVADVAQQSRLQLFHVGDAFAQLGRLYRRIEYKCRGTDEPIYLNENRPLCSMGQSTLAEFDHQPWNRSADWMINMPNDVIPGHGGFWHPESVELIMELTNVWPVLNREDSLP
jgi:hypothetical protein